MIAVFCASSAACCSSSAALGIQLRLSGRKLFGLRRIGIQGFGTLKVPLLVFMGQCGSRGIKFLREAFGVRFRGPRPAR